MARLTEAQKTAIAAIGGKALTVSFWGGQVQSGLPRGVRISTIDALLARKLVSAEPLDAFRRAYHLTPAGRALLSERARGDGT